MPATQYKIWRKGNSVGEGATGSIIVGISARAKTNSERLPHTVANELLAANLARSILLPCPPGFLAEDEDGQYFVSLDFNLAGHDLPPVIPTQLWSHLPIMATGVILFDLWIANPDRHKKNLAFYEQEQRLQVFDHSHALMGTKRGTSRLEEAAGLAGLNGRHCLAREATALPGADAWLDRIASVPPFYIDGVCASLQNLGYEEADCEYVREFLLNRQSGLQQLLESSEAEFPKITGPPLGG